MRPTLVVRIGQQMLDVLDEDDFFENLDVWWDDEVQRWDSGGTPMWTIADKVASALNRMKAQPEREARCSMCGPRRWYDGCELCGLQFEATIHRPGRTR